MTSGTGFAPQIADLRRLVDDLVHCAECEVDEVEVDDRTHAVQGGADARRDHGGLRDRRVEHALLTELRPEALDLREVPTALEQIGAQHEDPLVAASSPRAGRRRTPARLSSARS